MKKQLAVYKILDKLLSLVVFALPRKHSDTMNSPRRILVIKLSAMGDCLCLFPSVRLLAEAFPEASVDWFTSKRSNPNIFMQLPYLNAIHVLPSGTVNVMLYLVSMLARARRYDLIIDYDQYYRVSELISSFGRANAGFKAPLKGSTFSISVKYDPYINEKRMFYMLTEEITKKYRKKLGEYGFEVPEILDGFVPDHELIKFSNDLKLNGRPVVAVYPGSSMNASFRRWSSSNYIQLLQGIKNDYTALILGGADEISLEEEFSKIDDVFVAINRFSLIEISWLFANTIDIFVGNDGGLLHVADSQGVPIVGIFGPALYQKWGSANPNSIGIEHELTCRPCLRNYQGIVPNSCHLKTVECLTGIAPAEVEFGIRQVLNKTTAV